MNIQEQAKYWTAQGVSVFPVAVERTTSGKWNKRPLTPHGHKDACTDLNAFDWTAASGFGIVMGNGLYALDVDDYKSAANVKDWLTQHAVPMQTRAHKTISGGAHLIYRTTGEHLNLRSRQNVVRGLDTRGAGGWIAFGAGYSVEIDQPPAYLPPRVCKVLHAGLDAIDHNPTVISLPKKIPPNELKPYLEAAFYSKKFASLWTGQRSGRTFETNSKDEQIETTPDVTKSGNDWGVALILAGLNVPRDAIARLLLDHYLHGQCGPNSGKPDGQRLRGAVRCAERATYKVQQERDAHKANAQHLMSGGANK